MRTRKFRKAGDSFENVQFVPVSVHHVPRTLCYTTFKNASTLQKSSVTDRQLPCPFISHAVIKAELPHRRDVLHRKQHKVREHQVIVII